MIRRTASVLMQPYYLCGLVLLKIVFKDYSYCMYIWQREDFRCNPRFSFEFYINVPLSKLRWRARYRKANGMDVVPPP